MDHDIRPGEARFAVDPAVADDARLAFIGRAATAFARREDCPKNVREARQREQPAVIEIDEPYRAGLSGLAKGQWIHVLTWLGAARRDLAVQAPRHSERTHGTFSLRSPVRPNPIGLHLVRIVSVDAASGRLVVDALDVFDGTAVLDIKPFFETVDVPPASGAAAS